jgi:gliding motility-associated-like protein
MLQALWKQNCQQGVDIEQVNIEPLCDGNTPASRVSIEAYGSNGLALTYLLNNGQQNSTGVFEDLPEGNYKVNIRNSNNCFADTSFKIGKVYCNKLAVPTAFTPNHDGLNDILRPIGRLPAGGVYFALFNRWGQKIFETHNVSNGWDGSFQRSPQLSGAYIWLLQYKDANDKLVTERGISVLIR